MLPAHRRRSFCVSAPSPGPAAESMPARPRRRPSRARFRGLVSDLALVLAAALAGVGVAVITGSHSHWPAQPPLAQVAVMDSTTSGAWQALPPLQTTWRGNRGSAAPILGRAAGSWARIRHWRATGKTVLFLPIPQRPDVILLLRYQRLTPAGKPDGTPRRMQCTTATGCSKTRCTRHGAAGECVVMDNNLGYRDGPVVVVVVGWPKADTSPTGPGKRGWTTEYASWGFVTGQLPPRQAHIVRARTGREHGPRKTGRERLRQPGANDRNEAV